MGQIKDIMWLLKKRMWHETGYGGSRMGGFMDGFRYTIIDNIKVGS